MASQPQTLIVDTGYWYALYDPRDQHAKAARGKVEYLERLKVIIPWPCLYEMLGTRFVKNREGMIAFEEILKHSNTECIDDGPYREDAIRATLEAGIRGRRAISLCDMVIRLLIEDTNVRINALLTFNVGDFADVCRTHHVHII